jgi:hypothetical protein
MDGYGPSIHVEVVDYGQDVRIVPYHRTQDGRSVGYPTNSAGHFLWEYQRFPDIEVIPEEIGRKFLSFNVSMACILRDELIRKLGQSDMGALRAELEATKRHLEDLRSIIAKKLNVELEGASSLDL